MASSSPSSPSALEDTTSPIMSPSQSTTAPHLENLDPNTPPVKIKKKPGRKPNPASPAMRKAQNRVAQRAFRERKERHLRELEDQIKDMRTQRDRANKVSSDLRTNLEASRIENNYFKSIIMSMQTILTQHGIPSPEFADVPTTTAQQFQPNMVGSNGALPSSSPLLSSSYMQMSTSLQNNPLRFPGCGMPSMPLSKPLCFTMAEDMVMVSSQPLSPEYLDVVSQTSYSKSSSSPGSPNQLDWADPSSPDSPHQHEWDPVTDVHAQRDLTDDFSSCMSEPTTPDTQALIQTLFTNSPADSITSPSLVAWVAPSSPPLPLSPSPDSPSYSKFPLSPSSLSPHSPLPETIFIDANTQLGVPQHTPLTPLAAIQVVGVQLRLQNASKRSNLPYSIRPTPLQHAIPHDPRIDLMPSKHIRDRMIVFRDCFDLDACFHSLITEAKFHDGDPTDPMNWELPANFFSDYWFLSVGSDLERTNKWRRLRGEKEVRMMPPEGSYGKLGGGSDPVIDAMLQESMKQLST